MQFNVALLSKSTVVHCILWPLKKMRAVISRLWFVLSNVRFETVFMRVNCMHVVHVIKFG